MFAKRYKPALPSSSERIRKAMKKFQEMSKEKQIDLMVMAGSMTQQQADTAKKKLAEVGAGE